MGSPVIPTLTSTCSTLLPILEQPNIDTRTSVDYSSMLAFHHDDQTHPCKHRKWRPKCKHCGKLGYKIDKCNALHEYEDCGKPGHKIDKCYALHGRLPRFTRVPRSSVSSGTPAMFNKFLKWYKDQESSSSIAYVTHTSTSFVGLTRSSSPGLWVFDSGAIHHITSKKSLISFFILS